MEIRGETTTTKPGNIIAGIWKHKDLPDLAFRIGDKRLFCYIVPIIIKWIIESDYQIAIGRDIPGGKDGCRISSLKQMMEHFRLS